MDLNYTRGEWKVSHPLDNITYLGTQEGTIAKVQWHAGIPIPEQKANAQLISAAPDLYEACEMALKYFGKKEFPKTHSILTKALAKAEGRDDT